MKIFLIGQCSLHWGRMEFGNIGNYYIIEPFVRELHRVFGANTSIRTTFQMSDRFCADEKVEVVSMDMYYGWSKTDLSIALEELSIAQYYNKYGTLIKKTAFIEEVINSDLVIDFSGDIWGDNANIIGENRFLVGLIKDRVTQLLNKKTIMLAGSPGPFNNTETIGFAKEVFENFDLVTNREKLSREILIKAGFNVSKTVDVVCPSFLFESSPNESIRQVENLANASKSNRLKIGFILCGWNFEQAPFDKWPREDFEYEKFVQLVKHMIFDLELDVYLMSHSNGFPIPPEKFELQHGRDYPIIKQLQKILIREGVTENLYSLDGVYDAWDTKAIIGQFDFLVSGRVHGAIAGLSQCIPTVIIDYGHEPKAHKLKGFAQIAGVEQYIANPLDLKDMIEKVNHCYNNMNFINLGLKQRMRKIQDEAKEGFEIIKKIF